ncbi:uroporphyrinogen-III synthase [Terrarubrum flagellatum]|uniref:uroporphyrinogen-III synthase n=1 Tax=Terrirubrum flagellatum TaxID=2895980 RepID=UPI0031452CE7
MATILVTRPERQAARTAERLRADGREVIVSPVLAIAELTPPIPEGRADVVLATSANAAGWLTRPEIRAALGDRPVFAVGDQAAAAIREGGYKNVRSAEGDGDDLVELIFRALAPPARILAVVGDPHRDQPLEALREKGYGIVAVVAYEAALVEQLTAEAIAGLRYDIVDAVLHYSPRSARQFIALAQSADASDKLARLRHVCLSQEIADALPDQLRAHAAIADAPNEDSLFVALAAALDEAPAIESIAPEDAPQRPKRASRSRAPRVIEGEAKRVEERAEASETSAAPAITEDAAVVPEAKDASVPAQATSLVDAPASNEEAVASAETSPLRASAVSSADARDEIREMREEPRAAAASSATSFASASQKDAPPRSPSILTPLIVSTVAGAIAGAVVALLFALAPKPADFSALDQRFATLAPRSDLAPLQQKVDGATAAFQRDQAALRAQIEELAKRVQAAAQTQAPVSSGASASGGSEDLRTELEALKQQIAALQAKSDELARVTGQIQGAAQASTVMRRHALASAISQALTRGGAYGGELDALKALGATDQQFAALKPYAAGNAPSPRALADSFKPLAPRLIEQAQNVSATSSLADRAWASLRQLVRVRPVGEAQGDDVPSLVARIESALARGSLSDAWVAYEKLPAPQHALAAVWGGTLKQRLDAGVAAQSLIDEAARALAQPGK